MEYLGLCDSAVLVAPRWVAWQSLVTIGFLTAAESACVLPGKNHHPFASWLRPTWFLPVFRLGTGANQTQTERPSPMVLGLLPHSLEPLGFPLVDALCSGPWLPQLETRGLLVGPGFPLCS